MFHRFYISQFSYVVPVMAYTVCAVHGFFSSIVWASQGVLLGENSNDSDRGRKSGFFLAVYMFGSVCDHSPFSRRRSETSCPATW